MKKKNILLKKCSKNRFGLLPNCIVKKKNRIVTGAAGGLGKKKLYCDIAWWVENCIAREGKLYCNIEVCRKKKLYCNTPLCIVT